MHSAALLRVLLPDPIKQATSFASLSRPHLAPHDTVTTLLSCTPASDRDSAPKDKKAHGIFELSFAGPCPSRADKALVGNTTIVTGTKGWLKVDFGVKVGETSFTRTTIHTVTKPQEKEDDQIEEAVEVLEDPSSGTFSGIEAEILGFLNAVRGSDDGLGNPKNALLDVQLIEAALTSEGKAISVGFD